jgi:putative tryptophan/tyrosine transport system substrate-binding protein
MTISRRGVLLLGAVAGVLPGMVLAQKVRRIAWLSVGSRSTHGELYDAFRAGLLEHKLVPGKNLLIEERWADGWSERVPALVKELVSLQPEVIATSGTSVVRAFKRATTAIPIVAISTADPVGSGFAASLARPGGNITGGTNMNTDMLAKLVELAREAVPKAVRAAVLESNDPVHPQLVEQARAAARAVKFVIVTVKAATPPEIDTALATAAKEKAEVLIVLPNVFLNSQRARIGELAATHRIPVIAPRSEYATSGALLSYGPNLPHMYRRAAYFVDRILAGAKPGDLPMEQPTKFDLVLNAKAAKALGITMAPSLVARADRVVQ